MVGPGVRRFPLTQVAIDLLKWTYIVYLAIIVVRIWFRNWRQPFHMAERRYGHNKYTEVGDCVRICSNIEASPLSRCWFCKYLTTWFNLHSLVRLFYWAQFERSSRLAQTPATTRQHWPHHLSGSVLIYVLLAPQISGSHNQIICWIEVDIVERSDDQQCVIVVLLMKTLHVIGLTCFIENSIAVVRG